MIITRWSVFDCRAEPAAELYELHVSLDGDVASCYRCLPDTKRIVYLALPANRLPEVADYALRHIQFIQLHSCVVKQVTQPTQPTQPIGGKQ